MFQGTRVETFEVEVIDVIRNYLAKQDVILVRCRGERVERTGVAEGMSGSPVFIDGRIVGALAYTWSWVKEPIGGVTPIAAMLAEGEREAEGRASGAEPATPIRTLPPEPALRGAAGAALGDAGDLVPIRTPVCVGGFSPGSRARLAEVLSPLGLDVRAAGGGAAAPAPGGFQNLDAPLVPGATLIVDLLRGDFAAAVVGTLTYVDGDRIHAFGHPFQTQGETLWPLSVGYVYTVVPSRNISFKIGASVRPVGALVQDRPSGIVGRIGGVAPMVPFHVTMRNEVTTRSETFDFEVTTNTALFQRLLLMALGEAFDRAEATLGANTKRYRLAVKLKGVAEDWVYEDTIVAFDSGLSRILIGLVDRVMIHPTQRAEFERVDLDVTIEHVDRRALIESVAASRDEARPGDEVDLLVRLRRKEGGALETERLPVRVPADAPAGNLEIQVTGGDSAPADVAEPVDIADIPKLYAAFYKSTELVALVPTGRVDLAVGGRLVRAVPLSALARLARSPDSAGAKLHPVFEKVRRDVPYVVDGSAQATIRILR